MKMTPKIIYALAALFISAPVFAQTHAYPWQAPFQAPPRMDYGMPQSMTPEQMQEMQRKRHESMMKHREMMRSKQSRMMDRGMDCQHEGKAKQGHHEKMKHGKKHGKKHGQKHQEHRKQMEQRLERIESMLQQLLDQQASSTSAQ